MKTKELIKQLQEEDPSGENEVYVGNESISFVSAEPAYYDGAAKQVIRDKNGYAISGKYVRKGTKIQIHTISFYDLVFEDPNFQIDFSELNEHNRESTIKRYDKIREFSKSVDYDIDLDNFIEWVVNNVKQYGEYDKKYIEDISKIFFINNDLHNIKYTITESTGSQHDNRQLQWSGLFEVTCEDGFIKIQEKKKVGNSYDYVNA